MDLCLPLMEDGGEIKTAVLTPFTPSNFHTLCVLLLPITQDQTHHSPTYSCQEVPITY